MRIGLFAVLLALLFAGCASAPQYKEMLVIGDGISAHAPEPAKGWPNDWGMAASAREKDYVHRLHAKLRSHSPELRFTVDSIMYPDEMTGWVHMIPNDADLIVIQLSENYKGGISTEEYGRAYLQMIQELRGEDKTKTVVCLGPWNKPDLEQVIAQAAAEGSALFVSLRQISADPSSRIWKQDIGNVPNDQGMEQIAETVYQTILNQ